MKAEEAKRPYDDLDQWVRLTLELLDDTERCRALGDGARTMSAQYSIDRVAKEFVVFCGQLANLIKQQRPATPP